MLETKTAPVLTVAKHPHLKKFAAIYRSKIFQTLSLATISIAIYRQIDLKNNEHNGLSISDTFLNEKQTLATKHYGYPTEMEKLDQNLLNFYATVKYREFNTENFKIDNIDFSVFRDITEPSTLPAQIKPVITDILKDLSSKLGLPHQYRVILLIHNFNKNKEVPIGIAGTNGISFVTNGQNNIYPIIMNNQSSTIDLSHELAHTLFQHHINKRIAPDFFRELPIYQISDPSASYQVFQIDSSYLFRHCTGLWTKDLNFTSDSNMRPLQWAVWQRFWMELSRIDPDLIRRAITQPLPLVAIDIQNFRQILYSLATPEKRSAISTFLNNCTLLLDTTPQDHFFYRLFADTNIVAIQQLKYDHQLQLINTNCTLTYQVAIDNHLYPTYEFEGTQTNEVELDIKRFPITPGATYRIRLRSNVDPLNHWQYFRFDQNTRLFIEETESSTNVWQKLPTS